MTLILNCITPHFVLQVSDRRLTWPNGRVADEKANKMVVFKDSLIFGFTGIAQIGNQSTSEWVADTISKYSNSPSEEAIIYLMERLTEQFKKIPYDTCTKRLAVTAIGWGDIFQENETPVMHLISNFLDNWKPQSKAGDAFTWSKFIPGQKDHAHWWSTGADIRPKDAERLTRSWRRCLERPTGPNPITRHFVNVVRLTADRNSTVGRDAISGVLFSRTSSLNPGSFRGAVSSHIFDTPQNGGLHEGFFLFHPADASHPISYGPHLVRGGSHGFGMQIKNIELVNGMPEELERWRISKGLDKLVPVGEIQLNLAENPSSTKSNS